MYPEELVKPMREELTNAGFEALYTSEDVDNAMSKKGTTLVMVNSVCGCAAGTARPGAIASLGAEKTPTNLTTVFAGVEKESTQKAREFMIPFPASSPAIAQNLAQAYDEFC